MRAAWIVGAVVVGSIGCASVLGIPNGSASWCAAHPGHTYCEDFDVGDPTTRWSEVVVQNGGNWTLAPSDDSPPNLIALTVPSPLMGAPALAGFDKEFVGMEFTHVHIEADVKIVTPGGAAFEGESGFLLITDKLGGCLALAATPHGIGVENLPTSNACSSLTSTMGPPSDAGALDGGMPMGTPVGPLPPLNTWSHMIVDVQPDALGKGGGMLTIDFSGVPTGYTTVTIQDGTLVRAGDPLVGFSNSEVASSNATQIDYDNVTIDVLPL
jgi:hypothetical protein